MKNRLMVDFREMLDDPVCELLADEVINFHGETFSVVKLAVATLAFRGADVLDDSESES